MKQKKRMQEWRKLDNSAKIFPMASSKRFSTVFRLSCVLKEEIDPIILKQAVEISLEKYPYFKVMLRKGFFWYYFDKNIKEIVIEEEKNYPCKYIDKYTNNGYLFKITYFRNKINVDVFHSLTDGNSATEFFKEMIYTYIEIAHSEIADLNLRKERKQKISVEDSYMKNYDKKAKSNANGKKAYRIKGKKLPLDAISVIHEIIDFQDLKRVSKEDGATVTQYLTATLIYAIYQQNYEENKGKKPIKICIPVNLKKYFDSDTISNFFSYITIVADKNKLADFESILEFVKTGFEKMLQKEEIVKTMSVNVKIGNHPMIRIMPLILKRIIVQLSYIEIRKYTTTTFSNIGRIGILPEYRDYIENFMLLIAPETVETIKCSACSYEDKMTFTFTSILQDIRIQQAFYKTLISKGIKVKIQTNEVPYVISEDFQY